MILNHRRDLGALAQWTRVGAEKRHPDVLRVRLLLPMIPPEQRGFAASMVGRDDEGRRPAIFRHRLRRLPELPDVVVDAASGLKILCVVARVRPFVCFAQRQEEDARPRLFEVLDGR